MSFAVYRVNTTQYGDIFRKAELFIMRNIHPPYFTPDDCIPKKEAVATNALARVSTRANRNIIMSFLKEPHTLKPRRIYNINKNGPARCVSSFLGKVVARSS